MKWSVVQLIKTSLQEKKDVVNIFFILERRVHISNCTMRIKYNWAHTHKSSLAFVLHEEQLSPVSGGRLHPEHHQVAQRQHPQERRQEEFAQRALTVAWREKHRHKWIITKVSAGLQNYVRPT